MRRALLLLCLLAGPAHAVDIVGWVGIPLMGQSSPNVAVPDVVGEADPAAAEAVLEGVGLDIGAAAARCSAAAANEIVAQNPTAGTLVATGSLVDVFYSSGAACDGAPAWFDLGIGLDL